ncbi:MAG: hypothetical protein WDN28_16885 [Chthoniobacter sp.]
MARLRPPLWLRPWMLRTLPTPEAETLGDHHIFESCFTNYRESWRVGRRRPLRRRLGLRPALGLPALGSAHPRPPLARQARP